MNESQEDSVVQGPQPLGGYLEPDLFALKGKREAGASACDWSASKVQGKRGRVRLMPRDDGNKMKVGKRDDGGGKIHLLASQRRKALGCVSITLPPAPLFVG